MGHHLAVWDVAESQAQVSGSSVAPSVVKEKVNETLTPSPGDISPVWNPTAFRRSFPQLWAEYLRARYRTAYAVQKAFPGIDSKTARDWIGGKRDPSGSFVIAAVARDQSALEILGRNA